MKGTEHRIQIRKVSNGYMVKYVFGKERISYFGTTTTTIDEQEYIASSLKEALQMIASAAVDFDGMSDSVVESKLKLLETVVEDDE